MFNEEVIKQYKLRKLKDVKKEYKDKSYEIAEDFKEAETDEFKYCLARDYVYLIEQIREIEKEIKETENKEKGGDKIDKHINEK